MSEENTGEFNIHEAANEIIAEGDSGSASTDDSSQSGQAENASQENTGEAKELSPEEILKQVSQQKESPEQFAEILKGVNSLGMIRNGLPISVDSPDQLKELIQKGFDYTQKTMEHAELVKSKTEEFQQKEAQFKEREAQFAQKEQEQQDVLYQNQLLTSVLKKINSEDPELFAHLDALYSQEENSYHANRPMQAKFEGEINQLKNELKLIQGSKHSEELGQIKQGWEKELSEVQSRLAGPLAQLGVKGDWKKVQDVWEKDPTNKMSVEQAFYAVHGKDVASAYESQKKLLETKTKTQASMLGRTGVSSGQKGQEETLRASTGDYESILRMASATM